MPRSSAARASGRWAVVGAAMTTASRSASASIASGSAKAWAPDRAAAAAEGLGVEVGDGDQAHVGQAAQDAQVVAAHRAEADQPDAQLAVADRGPGGGHRAAARSGAALDGGAHGGDDGLCSSSVRPGNIGSDRECAAAWSVSGRSASMPRSTTYGWRWTGIG